jgi:5'-methylthioadenosine phosphorylase
MKKGCPMKFGIIGGSGLYEIEGLTNIQNKKIETPFGSPSDEYVTGNLEGKDVVFLPRHGRGHRLLPSEINYRANIWGMKSLGVTHLIAISAVGSLREEIAPGHIVLTDQFIDRTKDRPSTFFGRGLVAHLQFGDPTCSYLSGEIAKAAEEVGVTCHKGGTFMCMEGPMFSTRAESEMYRMLGASVIGMTNLQEAKLSREAELCFSTIALATDYDCWHESEEEVSVDAILEVIRNNVANTKAILKVLLSHFQPKTPECQDQRSLQGAILTQPDMIPEQVKKDLEILIGKYL